MKRRDLITRAAGTLGAALAAPVAAAGLTSPTGPPAGHAFKEHWATPAALYPVPERTSEWPWTSYVQVRERLSLRAGEPGWWRISADGMSSGEPARIRQLHWSGSGWLFIETDSEADHTWWNLPPVREIMRVGFIPRIRPNDTLVLHVDPHGSGRWDPGVKDRLREELIGLRERLVLADLTLHRGPGGVRAGWPTGADGGSRTGGAVVLETWHWEQETLVLHVWWAAGAGPGSGGRQEIAIPHATFAYGGGTIRLEDSRDPKRWVQGADRLHVRRATNQLLQEFTG